VERRERDLLGARGRGEREVVVGNPILGVKGLRHLDASDVHGGAAELADFGNLVELAEVVEPCSG
jgi:hypothetical protein